MTASLPSSAVLLLLLMWVHRGSCNKFYTCRSLEGSLGSRENRVVKGEMREVKDGGEILASKSAMVNKTILFFHPSGEDLARAFSCEQICLTPQTLCNWRVKFGLENLCWEIWGVFRRPAG